MSKNSLIYIKNISDSIIYYIRKHTQINIHFCFHIFNILFAIFLLVLLNFYRKLCELEKIYPCY